MMRSWGVREGEENTYETIPNTIQHVLSDDKKSSDSGDNDDNLSQEKVPHIRSQKEKCWRVTEGEKKC